ncbi:uncharacterized protein LOC122512860 [Leptopilina heterotoma]|uniref:uncharacterized protein LOC122512860 n=1 Tax=Leptopilina heterotoma TaxID=63436 RepID=UPI001CA9E5FB|nr:uncharacterized protein LOC122512860 [Leptopilina heterotoma]
MARTPRSAKISIDDRKLADLFKGNSKKISDDFEAKVDAARKTWSKIQEDEGKPKTDLNRRKSLRSSSVESTNDQLKTAELRRRSLRSSSIDKSSVITPSTENSCASSTCSSPKGEDKRNLRSRSKLAAITEADLMSMAAGDASIIELPVLFESRNQDGNDDEESDEATICLEFNNQEGDFSEIVTDVVDRIQQDINEELKNTEPQSFEALQTYNRKTPTNNQQKSKQMGGNKNNKLKRNFIPHDSIRTFFDSMAITVSSFPIHLQAKVKIEICKIVGGFEYDLTSSKAN